MIGYVVYVHGQKRFGFVHLHPRVPDFFFDHRQVIGEPIKRGDTVEFWLDDSPARRGLVAVEVKRVNSRRAGLAFTSAQLRPRSPSGSPTE